MDGASLARRSDGAVAQDAGHVPIGVGPEVIDSRIESVLVGPGLPQDFGDLQRMIDGLPEQIALLDLDWTIVAINEAWQKAAVAANQDGLSPPCNYLRFCETFAPVNGDAAAVLAGLRELTAGTLTRFRHVYAATGASQGRDYEVCISRIESGGRRLAVVARYEVTAMRALERHCRNLGSTLLRAQEQERRRIGRDLHDATAQSLVALHLSLIRLKGRHQDSESAEIFTEIEDTLGEVHREIRAIAYTLHPAPLQKGKLVEALEAMVRGFSARTGLEIGFAFHGTARPWSGTTEATLYRLAQEALANAYRHASATKVELRLVSRRAKYLHLLIIDDGIGMGEGQPSVGVGIPGMRSRVEDLGGRFSIRCLTCGTAVIATLPSKGRRASGRIFLGS